MINKRIFISCGQMTEVERAIGKAVKETIDRTAGFEAYFAATVHDLDSLGSDIFEALTRSSGFVAFLQNRGTVTSVTGDAWGIRSSVWVNQEIAILAYRQFYESTKIPVLAFKEPTP